MAKTISWLHRAPDIRKQVRQATDSHFHRRDIQRIFELQKSAASWLMDAMPRIKYGTGHIIVAEALIEFLDDVLASADAPALIDARRAANLYVSRRKPRTVVLKEKLGNGLASLPDYVTLTRGELRIKFENSFELMEAQMIVMSNMQAEWYEFCRMYEPEQPSLPSESAYEAIRLGREAKACLEAGYAARAGDYARQAAHHAHWVQVERATITIAEYDKEMEALEGVAGAVKTLQSTLSATDEPLKFGDLVSLPAPVAPKREPMEADWARLQAPKKIA
jgi:hypothetical protein